ncbi:MAG: LytR C-terminal domain-containing protein [Actinobacteria bacterium]|nr:LytR C-terminal domain-containing protein [Actinomycetota bacterium]MBW3648031.1 LytR C-terminal domain-containing protein [Actinomycetota bacterium]
MTRSGSGVEPLAGADPLQDTAPPAASPTRLSPARALTGAVVSVAGVLLGVGILLWVTDDPSKGPGPTVRAEPAPLAEKPPPEPSPLSPALPSLPSTVAPATEVPITVASPAPLPAAPPPPGPPPSLVVPVTVLNNSKQTGLAERAAARFDRGGWPVALTGNFRGQIPVTTVYYDPGLEASARAFAADFRGITRVRPRFSTLPARGVVVVLTREFSA